MVILPLLSTLYHSAPQLNEYRLLSILCVANACVLLQSVLVCWGDPDTSTECNADKGWAFAVSLLACIFGIGLLLLGQVQPKFLGGSLQWAELLLFLWWICACVRLTFQAPFHLVGNGYLGCWAAMLCAGRLAAEHFTVLQQAQAWTADPLTVLLVASVLEATQTIFIFSEDEDHIHIADMTTRTTSLFIPVVRVDRKAEEWGITFGLVSAVFCGSHFAIQRLISQQLSPKPCCIKVITWFSRCLAVFFILWWTSAVLLLTFHHPYLVVSTGYISCWVAWSASLALLYNVVGVANLQWLSSKIPSIAQMPELAILPLLSLAVLGACLADPLVAQDTDLDDKTLIIIISSTLCSVGATLLLCAQQCSSCVVSDKNVAIFGVTMMVLWAAVCFLCTFGHPFRLLGNGSLAAWATFISAGMLVKRQASALGNAGLDRLAAEAWNHLELAGVACSACLMVLQGAHDSTRCIEDENCQASYSWAIFCGMGSLAIALFAHACSYVIRLQTLFRWAVLLLSIWWSISLVRFTFYGPYVFADIAFVSCWVAFAASWKLCVKLWPECLGKLSDAPEFLEKPNVNVVSVVPANEARDSLKRNISFEKRGWGLDIVEDAEELKSLRSVLHVTDPENLGWGRDVRMKGKYKTLELVHAWSIDSPQRSKVYEFKKEVVNREVRLLRDASFDVTSVKTKLDAAAHRLATATVPLDDSIHEKLLLHGTKPEHALSILHNGLNEKLSGGLFGKGVYLAEDPSKIDQYCTIDEKLGMGDANVLELQKMLYKNNATHSGQLLYCFVARAVLGFPIYTKDGETNVSAPFQPIYVTADKRELTTIPNSTPPMHYHSLIAEAGKGNKVERHREFIVFDGDRLLLEYLVAYRRK